MRGSLALVEGERLLAEYTLQSSLSYLNRLLPGIQRLFEDTGRQVAEVQLLAVCLGPGNFTGLRIGLSTAKGLALALGCPVVTVGSLEALAANFPFSTRPIGAIMDAKKNEVYAAFFRCDEQFPQRVGDFLLLPPEDLAARLTSPTILTGPGLERYDQLLKSQVGENGLWAPPELSHIRAGVLARLGLRQLALGQTAAIDQLTPFYLRAADAVLPGPPKGGCASFNS
jgi:tRNA threonylcarbamoyladenosine biosynthesis protein TsaB